MAIRKIVPDTDEIMHKVCRPVGEINDRIKMLAEDMVETLKESGGVGLAGPQVGMLRRIFVINHIDEDGNDTGEFLVFINPEIIAKMGEQEGGEGCLSIPGHEFFVKRPQKVAVKALNTEGEEFVWEAENLMAKAVCHEYDHLEGKTVRDTCEYEIFPEEEEEGAKE